MTLQIVAGKPGSGKSYHTVTMLLQHLEDWSKFERKEQRPFDRVLYTNLPLSVDSINEYLTKKTGEETDVSHYIKPIDEDVRRQFISSLGKFPLAILPQNSMIVIDEVQKLFGAEMDTDKKHQNFNIEFRNYVSQHRHYGHDLIFITQSTDNIAKQITAMAEKLYQVENVKHLSLPFPINIPFSDLDVVKEAFGIKNQFYRVSVGKYQGRRVRYDGESTSHLMHPEIFGCYSSHTLSSVVSDRPSLNLTRRGAILWLLKKHSFHLTVKIAIAAFVLVAGYRVLTHLPMALSSAMTSRFKNNVAVTEPVKMDDVTVLPPPYPVNTPVSFNTLNGEIPLTVDGHSFEAVHSCGVAGCTHDHSLPVLKKDEKITAVFPLGVITDNGRRKIGQPVMIEGTEEILKICNVRLGLVTFESGKEIQVPK